MDTENATASHETDAIRLSDTALTQWASKLLAEQATGTDWPELERCFAGAVLGSRVLQILRASCETKNALTSRFEVLSWQANRPERYFAYVKVEMLECDRQTYRRPGMERLDPMRRCGRITTWTGEELGSAVIGPSYRDNFGGMRRSIWVKGNNGLDYHGTYFESAGDYCRIKACKRG
jgi:hypothetical protein